MHFLLRKEILYPLAALLTGLLIVQFRVLGFDFSRIPGDLGDARFNLYILEHAYQYSTGQVSEYWSAGMMYPAQEVISYSDNLLGSSPIYSLGRIFGLSRESAFQMWMFIVAIFNFAGAFLFFQHLVKRYDFASLGAFIYAFSIVLFSQMYHVQTMPRFAFPLVLLGMYLFHQRGEWKYLALAIWMMVWQFYCGIYLGFFALFIIGVYVLFSLSFNRASYINIFVKWRSHLWFYVHCILSVGAMYLLMFPYLKRSRTAIPYTLERILATVPRPGSYFYSLEDTLIWGMFSDVGDGWEWSYTQTLFLGGLATLSLVLCLVLLVKRDFRKRLIGSRYFPLAMACVFSFGFFIKFGSFSLYQFMIKVPGFGALRSLDRMVNLELLFAGMALVFLLHYFFKKWKSPWFFVLVLALLCIDNYKLNTAGVTMSKTSMQKRVDDLVVKFKGLPKNSIVCYQPDSLVENCIAYQLDAMLAAQELGLRSVNGYSATSPYGFDLFWRELNDAGRNKWFEMSGADTTHVVVIH